LSAFHRTLILLFALPLVGLHAQPKLGVVGGTDRNLGRIYAGSSPIFKFKIVNSGSARLVISRTPMACPCGKVDISSHEIDPRDTAIISVVFNSAGYLGDIGKAFAIESNDPLEPTVFVRFSLKVVNLIEAEPEIIYFGNMHIGSIASKSIRLRNIGKKPLMIRGISDSTQSVETYLEKEKLAPGEVMILTASVRGQKEGSRQGELVLETDNKTQPRVRIKFVINIIK